MRFYTFFLVSFVLSTHFYAQNSVQKALLQLQQDPSLKGSQWSICAYNTQTKDTIVSWNPDLALPGASITKLFSTAAALEILGADNQVRTQIFMEGTLDANGVLHGNIWVKGAGDVSLGSRYFQTPGTELQFLEKQALNT
jgi:D-alanyl-D-alanine carboxypeptidase/D-alanyl-D-alanine-endopeptidase (penicillin-binding protein 4)